MSAPGGYAFDPFLLDMRTKRLLRDGLPIDLSPRHFRILQELVARHAEIVTKDELIKAGWNDVAVSDSSAEKMVFQIRQRLDATDLHRYIRTFARQGYQFIAPVTTVAASAVTSDAAASVAVEREWTQALTGLQMLTGAGIESACAKLSELVVAFPQDVRFHIGLANAYAMQFDRTRTDEHPNVEALHRALVHAEEGWRLKPESSEASATRGHVLHRFGRRDEALAALNHAVKLRPDSWLNGYRLADVSWGSDRIDAARLALVECPGLPHAHWAIATVYIARNALRRAQRELAGGRAAVLAEGNGAARIAIVGFDGLVGQLSLALGALEDSRAALRRELALESRDHVFSRECTANSWYVFGGSHLKLSERDAARVAFGEALARVPRHPLAHAGLAILDGVRDVPALLDWRGRGMAAPFAMESAVGCAAIVQWAGDVERAAAIVDAALLAAPPGNAGWFLPIDPLIDVARAPEVWAPVLARLHVRAR